MNIKTLLKNINTCSYLLEFNKIVVFIITFLFVIDRVLKYLLLHTKTAVINTGISFSLFSNSNLIVHFIVFILALTFFVFYLYKNRKYSIPILFIIVGAFSNLIDRIIWGGVIDYINFHFFRNNIADIMIFVGLIWFSRFSLYSYKKF